MAKRKKYEFSIISYNQNSMRNESINIGAFLYNKDSGDAKYKLIPDNSFKIRGLASSRYQKDLFKSAVDYLNFMLKELNNDFSALLLNETIKNDLPEQIRFSKPHPVVTANEKLIFEKIIHEYVGMEYFTQNIDSTIITPKEKALSVFQSHKLLGNKVKKNVKIRPSKSVEMRFNIDFAYGEQNRLNLIDSAPLKENLLDDWYVKMVMLSSRYDEDSSILLLNDSTVSLNNDSKMSQMIYDLRKDSRIKSVDLGNKTTFEKLIDEIKTKSVDSEKLDSLIALNHHMAS